MLKLSYNHPQAGKKPRSSPKKKSAPSKNPTVTKPKGSKKPASAPDAPAKQKKTRVLDLMAKFKTGKPGKRLVIKRIPRGFRATAAEGTLIIETSVGSSNKDTDDQSNENSSTPADYLPSSFEKIEAVVEEQGILSSPASIHALAYMNSLHISTIVQTSRRFAAMSGRKFLLPTDVDRAAHALLLPECHSLGDNRTRLHINHYFPKIQAPKRQDSTGKRPLRLPPPSIQLHWLAVNGEQPDTSPNPIFYKQLPTPSAKLLLLDKVESIDEVCSPIQLDLIEMVISIVDEQRPFRKRCLSNYILEDVNIHRILPFVVRHIVVEMRKAVKRNWFEKIIGYNRLMELLIENPNSNVENYITFLLPLVISSLVAINLRDSCKLYWAQKKGSAILLANMVNRFATAENRMFSRVMSVIVSTLRSEPPIGTTFSFVVALADLNRGSFGWLLERSSILAGIGEMLEMEENRTQSFENGCEYIIGVLRQEVAPQLEDVQDKFGVLGRFFYSLIYNEGNKRNA